MEAGQVSVPGSDESLRTMQCGPVCIKTELSTPSLHQLPSRPICSGNRRIPGQSAGLRLSSIHLDRQMPPENTPGRFNSGAGSPGMAISAMVSMATGDAVRTPCPSANSHESSERPFQQEPPPASKEATATSRLESVRRTCSQLVNSNRASDIATAG